MASETGQISQLNKSKKRNKRLEMLKIKCWDSQSKIFLRSLQTKMGLGTLAMQNLRRLKWYKMPLVMASLIKTNSKKRFVMYN